MKKLLLSSCLSMFGTVAHAGPWTVGPVTPTYTNSHPLAAHDTAAAYAYEPADIADSGFTPANWLHVIGGANDCTVTPTCGEFANATEGKARFDCNDVGAANDDPIIFPGIQNGSNHRHRFFGNTAAMAAPYNATYASLRAAGNSTCYGGPFNRSLYWEPEMYKILNNGARVGLIPKNVVTYYEGFVLADIGSGKITDPLMASRWPRSIDMVFGFNMADPNGTRFSNITGPLNVAAGFNRYVVAAPGVAGGFVGWSCASPNGTGATAWSPNAGGGSQPYLKTVDGHPTLDCQANTNIYAEALSYPCWDGVNFTSPTGRDHFMPFLRDNNSGANVCPDNWTRVTQLRVKIFFNTTGQSDYTEWFASSDRMVGMTQFRNGESFHADFIPAWSYGTAAAPGIFLKFIVHCDGIPVTISGTTLAGDGHECGYGRISSTENVWVNEASPDGSSPNPVVNLNPDQTGIKRYDVPTTGTPAPGTVHNSHTMNVVMPPDTLLAGAAPVNFTLNSKGN